MTGRSEAPLVSVLIASSPRARELLLDCLRSLERRVPDGVPVETIVVLNESAAAAAEHLQSAFPWVRAVTAPVNLGFAGAGNRARELASGKYLVLLHDDAVVEPGWLEALLDAAGAHPEAGAIGCKVLFPNGVLQAAGFILWRDGSTGVPWVGEPPAPSAFDRTRAVDYSGTSSLLVRSEVWDAIGGLDERFFPAYYVDVDLCARVRQSGYLVLYEPRACIRHHRGASAKLPFRKFLSLRNRRIFLEKWGSVLELQEPLSADRGASVERAIARAEAAARSRRTDRALVADPATRPVNDATDREQRSVELDRLVQTAYVAHLTDEVGRLERDCEHWRAVASAANSNLEELRARARYVPGQTLRFCAGGEARLYPSAGCHAPEPWGAWIDGNRFEIHLPCRPPANAAMNLLLEAHHFLAPGRTTSPIRVRVNGELLFEVDEERNGPQQYEIPLPAPSVASDGLRVEIETSGAASPASLGVSEDQRTLSAGLISMTVRAIPAR